MNWYKVGPLPDITWAVAPITRVKSPQLPNYKAIYRGYNSIYNWQGPMTGKWFGKKIAMLKSRKDLGLWGY